MLKDFLVELRNKLTGTNRVVQQIKQSNSDLTINKLIDGIQELKFDLGTEKIIQQIKELKTILNRNNYSYLKTHFFYKVSPE
jgi:flagellin-specific chaperone FliS